MADTPIRHFRLENKYWDALGRIGKEMGAEFGRDVPQSWLIRKAIIEFVERHKPSKQVEPGK